MLCGFRDIFIAHQSLQIFIVDFRFLVGQILEAGKYRIKRFFAIQLDAELFQARTESIASG